MAVAANALTTLATVKAELGISSSAQDTTLERYINAMSDFVESYCNRKFYYEVGIAEKVPGYGTKLLQVERTPIVSISSITYDGTTIDTSGYEIHNADAGSIYNLGHWGWTAGYTRGASYNQVPGTERNLYTVTYTGGWITQEQDDNDGALTRNLPYDLEDAVISMVVWRYANKGRDYSLASEKLLSGSQTYRAVGNFGPGSSAALRSLLPGVAITLDKYKRFPQQSV